MKAKSRSKFDWLPIPSPYDLAALKKASQDRDLLRMIVITCYLNPKPEKRPSRRGKHEG